MTLPVSSMLGAGISRAHRPVCSQTDPETSDCEKFLFHPSSHAIVETCRNERVQEMLLFLAKTPGRLEIQYAATITHLFLIQRDPSTISPYASLNNCRAFGEIFVFRNTRFSSAAANSLSPICSGKPTRESTW